MFHINEHTHMRRMYIISLLFVIDSFFDMDPRWKHLFTAIVAGPT